MRILSDLHYADPGSWLERPEQLDPLLQGVDHVILNGDSLDTQVQEEPEKLVAELRAYFAKSVRSFTFIVGNHDPDISESNEVFLADGRIWVTHGHVFFEDVAPWSQLADEIRRRLRALAPNLSPTERENLETRFRLFRQVCQKLPREVDLTHRGTYARLNRIARAVFPPRKLLSMLRVWREYPDLVEHVSAVQRPQSEIVITGHTHFHGVWRQPSGRVIVNTGSLCPPRGGQLVDVSGDKVTIRKIVRHGRQLHPGPIVAAIALAPTGLSKLSASS